MNRAWVTRLLAAGGLVTGCAIGAACTVTSGDGTSTLGDGGSSGGDSSTGGDSGTDGSASCAIIGTSVTFNPTGTTTCDPCMAKSCCAETTACFSSADGGTSDCEALHGCIRACEESDGGSTCTDVCKDPAVHSADSVAKQKAFEDCYVNQCRSTQACP